MVDHGVVFLGESGGGNLYGDCAFCHSPKFYVNQITGQWDCKKCRISGNLKTWLTEVIKYHAVTTTDDHLRTLARWRKLSVRVLNTYGVVYDGSRFLVPIWGINNRVQDIRKVYIGKKVRSTKGCSTGLIGMKQLTKSDLRVTIYLTAGEWDTMAMNMLLKKGGIKGICVGTPGENVFKKEWIELFQGRKVVICYDNDLAGDQGAARVGGCVGYPHEDSVESRGLLHGVCSQISFLRWPDVLPNKYDLNDFWKDHKKHPNPWREFAVLIQPEHRRTNRESAGPAKKTKAKRVSFRQVCKEYRKWMRMTQDTIDALRLVFATAISVRIPGEPIWLYLVAPPGGGKTALLLTLNSSEHVVFRSSLSSKMLVSGWKQGPKGDPSLLPELDQKCFILKDFTEVLSMRVADKDEIYGTLRGAYDGTVERQFGNGVLRNYKVHFSMVAGVTAAIHGISGQQSSMGERFLKFQLSRSHDDDENLVRAAIRGLEMEDSRSEALSAKSSQFLNYIIDKFDPLDFRTPLWVKERIKSLATLCAMLRAGVERDYQGDVTHRADFEVATRFSKQLLKLGWALTVVNNVAEIDWDIYLLLKKVAMDSSTGFSREIVTEMMIRGGKKIPLEVIREATGLPNTTVMRRMDDLNFLGIVYKSKDKKQSGPGRRRALYTVQSRIRILWGQVHDEEGDPNTLEKMKGIDDGEFFGGRSATGGDRPR